MTEVEPAQVEISPDKTQAWTLFKELSYTDFGRSGTLQCFRATRMMEGNGILISENGFLDIPKFLTNDYGLFPIGMHYRFQPALWGVRRGTSFPCQVPASSYSYDVTVAESDTDSNNHTNQGTYVRFCSDATHAAVKEGRLPRLEPDVYDYPLVELQTIYLDQSSMGRQAASVAMATRGLSGYHSATSSFRKKKSQKNVIFHGFMLFGQLSALLSQL